MSHRPLAARPALGLLCNEPSEVSIAFLVASWAAVNSRLVGGLWGVERWVLLFFVKQMGHKVSHTETQPGLPGNEEAVENIGSC